MADRVAPTGLVGRRDVRTLNFQCPTFNDPAYTPDNEPGNSSSVLQTITDGRTRIGCLSICDDGKCVHTSEVCGLQVGPFPGVGPLDTVRTFPIRCEDLNMHIDSSSPLPRLEVIMQVASNGATRVLCPQCSDGESCNAANENHPCAFKKEAFV